MEAAGERVQQAEAQEEVSDARRRWSQRPYARTFDLISSEYGWTDDVILNLTMARMRQIREVIFERHEEVRYADLQVREVELRTLAGFVAGAAGWKSGVKDAQKIALLPRKKVVKMIPFEKIKGLFSAR